MSPELVFLLTLGLRMPWCLPRLVRTMPSVRLASSASVKNSSYKSPMR